MSPLSAAATKLLSPLSSVLSMSLCTFESEQLEAEVCYMSPSGLAALWKDRGTHSLQGKQQHFMESRSNNWGLHVTICILSSPSLHPGLVVADVALPVKWKRSQFTVYN